MDGMEIDDLPCSRNAWEEKGSLVVLLLAERAPSEGPRPMRAVESNLGHSPLKWWEERKEKAGLAIPCARATRGRGLPSLDARTMGIHRVTEGRRKWNGLKGSEIEVDRNDQKK